MDVVGKRPAAAAAAIAAAIAATAFAGELFRSAAAAAAATAAGIGRGLDTNEAGLIRTFRFLLSIAFYDKNIIKTINCTTSSRLDSIP